MKTLTASAIVEQLSSCGVHIKDPLKEISSIFTSPIIPGFLKEQQECLVNAIRLSLIQVEPDFIPADIKMSSNPDHKEIIVFNKEPWIVDYVDTVGVILVSMDGSDSAVAPHDKYPILGRIII